MNLQIIKKTTLEDLPHGSLFLHGKTLALKTGYRTESGIIEAHIVGSGEMFCGGTSNPKELALLEVLEVTLLMGF